MGKKLNSIYRWMGILPYDDFEEFEKSLMKALEGFERFAQSVTVFNGIVANRLDIKHPKAKVKKEKQLEKEVNQRGMFW